MPLAAVAGRGTAGHRRRPWWSCAAGRPARPARDLAARRRRRRWSSWSWSASPIRPYVQTVHGHVTPLARRVMAGYQQADHLPVDPTRLYYEISLHWVFWYIGMPAVVLGTLGAALLARRCLRGRGSRMDAAAAGLRLDHRRHPGPAGHHPGPALGQPAAGARRAAGLSRCWPSGPRAGCWHWLRRSAAGRRWLRRRRRGPGRRPRCCCPRRSPLRADLHRRGRPRRRRRPTAARSPPSITCAPPSPPTRRSSIISYATASRFGPGHPRACAAFRWRGCSCPEPGFGAGHGGRHPARRAAARCCWPPGRLSSRRFGGPVRQVMALRSAADAHPLTGPPTGTIAARPERLDVGAARPDLRGRAVSGASGTFSAHSGDAQVSSLC